LLNFSTSVSGPGVDTVNGTYTWTSSPTGAVAGLSNTTIGNPTGTFSGNANDQIDLFINYQYGVCSGTDTVNLRFNPGIPQIVPAMDTICPGDTISIAASLTNLASPALPIRYQWTPNFAIDNDTIGNIQVWPAGTTTYTVQISEGTCVMTDSVTINVNTTIPIPTVTCGLPVNYPTEILFNWGGSLGATGWEYSTDSGSTWTSSALTNDSLLLTGFTNGDCFQLQVRATGPSGSCPVNAAALHTCCTQPCMNPTMITTLGTTDLSCYESADGTVSYLGTAGDQGPNYTFNLYNASTNSIVSGPLVTADSTTFTGLSIGSYYSIATDAFGCIAYSDTVTLTQPTPLIGSLDTTTLTSCWNTSDGTATVSGAGGTGPYTYLWSDGQSTATAVGLALGVYSATVIDANNCEDVVSNINVFGPFAQAPFITLNTVNSTTCIGNGTATILSVQSLAGDPNPGTPSSLSYAWFDLAYRWYY